MFFYYFFKMILLVGLGLILIVLVMAGMYIYSTKLLIDQLNKSFEMYSYIFEKQEMERQNRHDKFDKDMLFEIEEVENEQLEQDENENEQLEQDENENEQLEQDENEEVENEQLEQDNH